MKQAFGLILGVVGALSFFGILFVAMPLLTVPLFLLSNAPWEYVAAAGITAAWWRMYASIVRSALSDAPAS